MITFGSVTVGLGLYFSYALVVARLLAHPRCFRLYLFCLAASVGVPTIFLALLHGVTGHLFTPLWVLYAASPFPVVLTAPRLNTLFGKRE